MKAIDLIASSLNIRGDEPNQALADEIIRLNQNDWVKELVENLKNKDKNIQSDCIKTLYEVGERGRGDMLAPYCKEFCDLLASKNNRLVWGAMTAIDTLTPYNTKSVFDFLPLIIRTIENGSVITIDHGVGVLAKLAGNDKYSTEAFPLLLEQLKKCQAKQLPMYAEKSIQAVNDQNKEVFIELLKSRIPEMEKDSQIARINKVIKKILSKK